MAEKAIFIILLMMVSGVLSMVTNKYLVSNLNIRGKFFILTVQTLVIVFFLLPINISFYPVETIREIYEYKEWMRLGVLLTIMIYSGLQANIYFSISLFTVLKNGTIPLIAMYDSKYMGYQIQMLAIFSFGLIIFSSILGMISDSIEEKKKEKITGIGIGWITTNCLISASYIIRLTRAIKTREIPSMVGAMYANAFAFPLVVIFSLIESFSFSPALQHIDLIIFSGATSVLIAVSTSLSASNFSTTTLVMLNALNKTPVSLSGVIFRIEKIGSVWKWLSIAISGLSAILYSISRASVSHSQ
ncbi:GDP-mannose transporter [Nematocida sp. LUAm3]|nr:GDP-mannose transporter [Nematocida sp. LUAm3]KAI5176016.1 GDP-mannose transporter [Nematocida sp. LUAm2]KAI5179113.1 GDP-mannose transporter [Nematocida sp. LUAm1]